MTLQAAGLPVREFAQTTANCTAMGQMLLDLLTGKSLVIYANDELRQQALSTVAVEHPRGWRIAKEKASRKIDAIVALPWRTATRLAAARPGGFNRSAHVAKETLRPYRDSIFIGQTVQSPSTVIAQSDHGGITVLCAMANPGISLRRHLETVVKPWLSVNCHGR